MNEKTKTKTKGLVGDERVQRALDALSDFSFSTTIKDIDTTVENRTFAKMDVDGFYPDYFRGEVRSAHFEQIGERNLIRLRINVYTGKQEGPDACWDKETYEARFNDGEWSEFVEVS